MAKMDPRIAEWLTSGDTGLSSKNIMIYMSSGVKPKSWHDLSPPADPSDLGRCLRLLEQFPEWKSRMPEMAELGGAWPTYVKHWDEMTALMAEEAGIDWSKAKEAPRTYAFMRKVREEAYAARNDGVKSVKIGSGVTMSFRP